MKVYDLIVVNYIEGTAYNSGPASYSYNTEQGIRLFKKRKDAKRWVKELKKLQKRINIFNGEWPKGSKIDGTEIDFSWLAFVDEYKIIEREIIEGATQEEL